MEPNVWGWGLGRGMERAMHILRGERGKRKALPLCPLVRGWEEGTIPLLDGENLNDARNGSRKLQLPCSFGLPLARQRAAGTAAALVRE